MTAFCRHCGRKRGHHPKCETLRPEERERPWTVETAREWFRRFGHYRNLISENGAKAFRTILKELDRMKK